MSNKNVKVKLRLLALVEEIRDKSDRQARPGSNKAAQQHVILNIPVLQLPAEEWAQRLADVSDVFRYGNEVDNDKPAIAITNPATGVTHTIADLSGHTILSQLIATTVTIEYGITEALGSVANVSNSPVATAGPNLHEVTLAGLPGSTKVYYRMKVVNATKTVYGLIHSFTTLPTP